MRLPLFTAAHAAARVLVSNRPIFDEFIRRRKIAAKRLVAGNVFLRAGAVAHHSTHDLLSRETAGKLCSSKLVAEPSTGMIVHPACLSDNQACWAAYLAFWSATPIVLSFAMAGGVFYGAYKFGAYIFRQRMSQQAFEKRLTDVNECEYTSSFCP
jgi:hypothetical protein